jgi:hypothetical protein
MLSSRGRSLIHVKIIILIISSIAVVMAYLHHRNRDSFLLSSIPVLYARDIDLYVSRFFLVICTNVGVYVSKTNATRKPLIRFRLGYTSAWTCVDVMLTTWKILLLLTLPSSFIPHTSIQHPCRSDVKTVNVVTCRYIFSASHTV